MAQKILDIVDWLDRWFLKKINVVTQFSDPLTDTKVPSEKLIKTYLDDKVDKIQNMGLSTNDYDNVAKGKVDALKNVALTGSYNDLTDKPTIPDVSGKEDTSNKVTAISDQSTDTQYPSAKCVYDALFDIEQSKADASHTHNVEDLQSDYFGPLFSEGILDGFYYANNNPASGRMITLFNHVYWSLEDDTVFFAGSDGKLHNLVMDTVECLVTYDDDSTETLKFFVEDE